MQIIQKTLLGFLSIFYLSGVWLRNFLYNSHIWRAKKYPIKVISIGNLTVGGTGKTPMAEYLISEALSKNIRVAYLSRGYGRKKPGVIQVDIQTHTSNDVGDEALQVAYKFSIPVVVAESRAQGIEYLLSLKSVDLVILDDAFQHRQVYRDVDIVMIDATRPPHTDSLLPLGRLREPLANLKRANVLVFSKTEDFTPDELINLKNKYKFKNKIVVKYKPEKLISLSDSREIQTLFQNKLKPCVALSGIGNSVHFERTLHKSGFEVVRSISYPDHHYYSERDIKKIKAIFKKYAKKDIYIEPLILITTEKDFRRMQKDPLFMQLAQETSMFFLDMSLNLVDKAEIPIIEKFLEQVFEHQTQK